MTFKRSTFAGVIFTLLMVMLFVFPMVLSGCSDSKVSNKASDVDKTLERLAAKDLNPWDDYAYWDQIIKKDWTKYSEVICIHGAPFLAVANGVGTVIPLNHQIYTEAWQICRKRSKAPTD